MDSWSDIRRKARACHQRALAKANGDRRAAALLKAALANADLELRYYQPGTTFGPGVLGSFEREPGLVNVARGQDPRDEAVVTAHEIGHSDLHHDPISEVTLKPAGLGGDPVESGERSKATHRANARKSRPISSRRSFSVRPTGSATNTSYAAASPPRSLWSSACPKAW